MKSGFLILVLTLGLSSCSHARTPRGDTAGAGGAPVYIGGAVAGTAPATANATATAAAPAAANGTATAAVPATANGTSTAAVPATANGTSTAAAPANGTVTAPGFGRPVPIERYTCPLVLRGGSFRSFMAAADTRVAFVDGDDLLALVNRSPTGALPPEYAPSDLVDLRDDSPRKSGECDGARECLRRDAALGLKSMLAEMRAQRIEGHVQSAFRGFGTQCWVFASWAHQARGGFCEAAEQSALPGHSQHQLGTTLDLFTKDWAAEGARTGAGVFRNGFGCSDGGTWLSDNAWRFGFVVSYPLHPDDRKGDLPCATNPDRPSLVNPKTGYKSEPWHLRFIGIEPSRRYHDAWQASGPGTPEELTLEQWLRTARGLDGDAELPVCDGCQCSACATLATDELRTPCGKSALWLDGAGHVVSPSEQPHLLDARVTFSGGSVLLEAVVHAPAHTPTQTPIFDGTGPIFSDESTYLSVAPRPEAKPRPYPQLPGAWRLGVEPVSGGSERWPWRVSLSSPELAATWNRANVVLPARPGDTTVRMRISAPVARRLRIALVRDGLVRDSREVALE